MSAYKHRLAENPNCSGSHCREKKGEVRVYPLGGGANLILCRDCWCSENGYRLLRARQTKDPDNWPQVDWDKAEIYGKEE